MRRATFQRPRVSLQANDVTHQEESPAAANEQVYDEVHQDSSDLALPHPGTEADRTDVISELEKQIENEIIEDRLRNSDVVEWALSSRSARNIKVMGKSVFCYQPVIYVMHLTWQRSSWSTFLIPGHRVHLRLGTLGIPGFLTQTS